MNPLRMKEKIPTAFLKKKSSFILFNIRTFHQETFLWSHYSFEVMVNTNDIGINSISLGMQGLQLKTGFLLHKRKCNHLKMWINNVIIKIFVGWIGYGPTTPKPYSIIFLFLLVRQQCRKSKKFSFFRGDNYSDNCVGQGFIE